MFGQRWFVLVCMMAMAFGVVLVAETSFANPLAIDPSVVDPSTMKMRGEHLVYEPTGVNNGKLLITIGGTSSLPRDFRFLHEAAVSLGYHVIALDYPNSVISTTCRKSVDRSCFDRFRKEIVLGIDVSENVSVDVANSIMYRLRTLLWSLRDRGARWKMFFESTSPDGIDWSKVAIAGHSQGSGHAAYISKLRPLERVVLIAGPQDSFDPDLAPWITRSGATAADRYFSLLHAKDFFGAHLQYAVFSALVSGDEQALRQIIVSNKEVKDGHMEVIQNKFRDEWIRLLR